MKKSLSGNIWGGSAWNGTSVFTKQTQEQNADGSYTTVTADFRKYACVEESIADHSAYLLGAMNGSKLRYDDISGMTDYKAVAQLIKDGGYATSLTNTDVPFLVKVSITDLNIRTGAGTNYAKTGKYTGVGVFTITEVKSGTGSTLGWGELKSGAGWIALDHVTKV